MTMHPLKVGDRVRHAGQQYTGEATATIREVRSHLSTGTWEYLIRNDTPWPTPVTYFSWWNSEVTAYVDYQRCPDDGRCHHECGVTSCFRVVTCSPLSAHGEDWTPEEYAANPPENLRPSIEAMIVSADG
jgi:hypothetical protein